MSVQAIQSTTTSPGATASISRVEADEAFVWLAAGLRDFTAAPGASLFYGILFSTAAAGAVFLSWSLPGFTMAFLSGLLLVGPVLAVGLYAAARQMEAGEPARIGRALSMLRASATNLALFGVLLALIFAAWVRVSALLFALKFSHFHVSVEGYAGAFSASGDPVAAAYFIGIGLVLAVTVFVIGAVSMPMILDRNCNPLTAIATSARAVAVNWPAMLVWASMILIMTGVGVMTGFIGMIVLFPVLGYATWHSYRAMVRRQ